MIWAGLLTLILTPVRFVFSALPSVTIPFFSNSSTTQAFDLGGKMYSFDGLFPIQEMLNLLVFTVKWVLPAVLAYVVANWIWRHLPIPSLGTGGG